MTFTITGRLNSFEDSYTPNSIHRQNGVKPWEHQKARAGLQTQFLWTNQSFFRADLTDIVRNVVVKVCVRNVLV